MRVTAPSAPSADDDAVEVRVAARDAHELAGRGDELEGGDRPWRGCRCASPEPCVAVATAPRDRDVRQRGEVVQRQRLRRERLGEVAVAQRGRSKATVPASRSTDDVGRQRLERHELVGVGDVGERVARAEHADARRAGDDLAQLVERSPAGAAGARGSGGCRPSSVRPRAEAYVGRRPTIVAAHGDRPRALRQPPRRLGGAGAARCSTSSAARPRASASTSSRGASAVNASTASRLLATLEAGGVVERAPDAGPYRLGLRLVALADGVLARLDVRDLARPRLRTLVDGDGGDGDAVGPRRRSTR